MQNNKERKNIMGTKKTNYRGNTSPIAMAHES
jgi:hypothetical protein